MWDVTTEVITVVKVKFVLCCDISNPCEAGRNLMNLLCAVSVLISCISPYWEGLLPWAVQYFVDANPWSTI